MKNKVIVFRTKNYIDDCLRHISVKPEEQINEWLEENNNYVIKFMNVYNENTIYVVFDEIEMKGID